MSAQDKRRRRVLATQRPSLFVKNGKLMLAKSETKGSQAAQVNQYSIAATQQL